MANGATASEPAGAGTAARLHEADRRHIVADGAFFSGMVGLGEAYVPAFALAIGFGDLVAGLIASLPILAGAFLQLATPAAVRWLASYRRWTVLCASLQAASFLPLIVGALFGGMPLSWLVAATVSYWAFGMATSPAWNAWITSLIPAAERPTFFARRTRIAQSALLAAMVVAGIGLEWGRSMRAEGPLFAALFGLALLARARSAWHLSQQSETPGLAHSHPAVPTRVVIRAIRDADSARVLAYLVGMQAAVWVAAPFFTPYMLGPIGLSYAEYMALTAVAFAARIAMMPALGRWAQSHGTRAILWGGAAGIVFLPVLWLVSHAFFYLFVVQIAAGCAWAALELATTLTFFEGIRDEHRASVLTAYNLANALAIGLGTLIGGTVFMWLEASAEAYALLFAISTTGRAAMLWVLRGTSPAPFVGGFSFRTLAVRPTTGGFQRPILATTREGDHGEGESVPVPVPVSVSVPSDEGG